MDLTLQVFERKILTDRQCLSLYTLYTCKHCRAFKIFDEENFDCLIGSY